MDRKHAALAAAASALLVVGLLGGRSLGQGDAAANQSYTQAATDQRVRALEAEKATVEAKLAEALKDRAELAEQLSGAGPIADVGGVVNTVTKDYEVLKAKLAEAEGEAKRALAESSAKLAKAEARALEEGRKLREEVKRLREENRKLREDVDSLGKKVDSLNTTIQSLKGFQNPFGR